MGHGPETRVASPASRSTRRRGSSSDGKNDPVRVLGIATCTSPASVDTVSGRGRCADSFRVSVRWCAAAPIRAVSSSSISSCNAPAKRSRNRVRVVSVDQASGHRCHGCIIGSGHRGGNSACELCGRNSLRSHDGRPRQRTRPLHPPRPGTPTIAHGLAGEVAVGPPLHKWAGHLEAGGDLADRPPVVDDEPSDGETVSGSQGSGDVRHWPFHFTNDLR